MSKGPDPIHDPLRSNAFEAFEVPDYLAIVDRVEASFNASNAFQRKAPPETPHPRKRLNANDLHSEESTFNAKNAFNAGEERAVPAGPVCLDCRQPVDPNDLFCDPCFQARKVVPLEDLARRREERRHREIARLAHTPCSSCGVTDWHTNARGDSFCRGCFPGRRTS